MNKMLMGCSWSGTARLDRPANIPWYRNGRSRRSPLPVVVYDRGILANLEKLFGLFWRGRFAFKSIYAEFAGVEVLLELLEARFFLLVLHGFFEEQIFAFVDKSFALGEFVFALFERFLLLFNIVA